MNKIFPILLAVVAIGAALFLLRLGVVQKLFSFKFDLFSDLATSSFPTFTLPQTSYTSRPPSGSNISSLGSGQREAINSGEIPAGFNSSELSPFFHKIKIGSVSIGSDFSYNQISLYAGFGITGTVNITGWRLQSNNGSQFIPQAINLYDSAGLASDQDIYFKIGSVLNIYSSASAIGRNLRINKCLGYLETTNHFAPALPMNCPSIDRRDLSSFSGDCQDYISSLGACGFVAPNPPVPQNDYACRSFLDTLNYRGCLDRHLRDSDFLSDEWRVWTGSKFLDPRHDRVLLFDRQGLLVDEYNY